MNSKKDRLTPIFTRFQDLKVARKDIMRAITFSLVEHMRKSYELLMYICHVAKM
ncbi:hypothetical protein ERIG_03993 [Escherichia fergusonii B253]|nr:hypothetical protein ERIG_03993 [Escherichia fergusonii B253]